MKPQNVLFSDNHHVRLSDFGLRKKFYGINFDSIQKEGYFYYKAPELINLQQYDKTLDWYLLGALLYEMVVGKPAYYNDNNEQIKQSILTGPLKFPYTASEDVMDLISKLMQRDPTKRLGAGDTDAKEIMAHPFFANIDWDEVKGEKLELYKCEIQTEVNIDPAAEQFFLAKQKQVIDKVESDHIVIEK